MRRPQRSETLRGEAAPAEAGARRVHARLLCAAAVLHLVLSAAVYGLGRYGYFPNTFDKNGVATAFASDGVRHRADAAALSEALRAGEIRLWVGAERPFHVKLYSVCFALFGPWLGFNVLGVAPLNALYYLSTLALVFGLGREVFDRRAGLTAACAVALWPSFLLHTTQFLKDPLYVAGMLALVLIMVRWLTRTHSWARALLNGLAGALLATTLWVARPDMGEVLVAVALLGASVLAVMHLLERRRGAANLCGMALIVAVTLGVPLAIPDTLKLGVRTNVKKLPADGAAVSTSADAEGLPATTTAEEAPQAGFWSRPAARVGKVRRGFIRMYGDSGSNIDTDVQIDGTADLLRYLPRAAAVGFFAPFPGMWFASGKMVGEGGRLLGGFESLLMYAVEALALVGLWRGRRRLAAWLLLSVAATGIVALGLVVVNVGTLFRMRYVFLMLLIVLAAGGAARVLERLSKGPRGFEERDVAG